MPEHDVSLSLKIPFPASVDPSPKPLNLVQSAESEYSHASTMDYTPASPSFEFSDILSPEAYELDAPASFAMLTDQRYQYLSLGQTKHNSQPNTPTRLQTAFDQQWTGPSSSITDAQDTIFPSRPRSQTITTPHSGTYAPYAQPFSSFSSTSSSSFGPFTPASGNGMPPTPFTDLAKDQLYHGRVPSVTDSVSSVSSATSSVAESPFDHVSDMSLPALVNGKPPRFKPTPKQLAILLQTYERTKHINADERERLARRLGGGVKPRHVQVWFQNRRSKSRNKESPMVTSALHLRNSPNSSRCSSRSGLQTLHGGTAFRHSDSNIDHLLMIVNESQPDLIFLPITKLVIGDWSRLLSALSATSPGSGPVPDLIGYASPSDQTLTWYLSYAAYSFKLVYSLANLVSVNPDGSGSSGRDGTVSIRFETCAPPVCYTLTDEGWCVVADFTDDKATTEIYHRVWGPSEGLINALQDLMQVSAPFAQVCSIPGLRASTSTVDIQSSLQSFHFPQPVRRQSDGIINTVTTLQQPSMLVMTSLPSQPVRGHHRRRSASQPLQSSESEYSAASWTSLDVIQHDFVSQSSYSTDLPFIDMSALNVGSNLSTGPEGWDTAMEPTPTHTTPGYSPAVWSPAFAQAISRNLHQQLASPPPLALLQTNDVVLEHSAP